MSHSPGSPIADLGVVIAAGGEGRRFGHGNKLLVELAGQPVFSYSLRAFLPLCPPGHLILVVPAADRTAFQDALTDYTPDLADAVRLVVGGPTRDESVRQGLAALPATAVWAAVHDAARPLADAAMLHAVLAAARKHGGAVAGRKVTDTLKECDADGQIIRTVDRNPLWRVETPQIFRRAELLAALTEPRPYEQAPTDDAAAMEACGHRPHICAIRQPNPKITTPEDLALAAACLCAT